MKYDLSIWFTTGRDDWDCHYEGFTELQDCVDSANKWLAQYGAGYYLIITVDINGRRIPHNKTMLLADNGTEPFCTNPVWHEIFGKGAL